MGLCSQVIVGHALNPSTTVTAVTMNTGDSSTVNNFDNASPAYLDQVFADNATGGIVRVRSPRFHDNVQGIRLQAAAAKGAYPLLDSFADQLLYASDILTIETTGGASETDSVGLCMYYTNLPGSNQRLANWSEIQNRIVNLMATEVDPISGGTAGDWGTGRAINADFDNFKANQDYALLGYTTLTATTAVAIAGADTSNFKVGGPGVLDPYVTRAWFVDQNLKTGRPYIPIINSNNRGGTLCYVANVTATTTVKVSLLFAQLS